MGIGIIFKEKVNFNSKSDVNTRKNCEGKNWCKQTFVNPELGWKLTSVHKYFLEYRFKVKTFMCGHKNV